VLGESENKNEHRDNREHCGRSNVLRLIFASYVVDHRAKEEGDEPDRRKYAESFDLQADENSDGSSSFEDGKQRTDRLRNMQAVQ
jgi:hypothetical protein